MSSRIPCGSCDVGIYNEPAMLNKTARAFGVLSEAERLNQMPRCKKHDRPCVGATDFHNMICMVDEEFKQNEKEETAKISETVPDKTRCYYTPAIDTRGLFKLFVHPDNVEYWREVTDPEIEIVPMEICRPSENPNASENRCEKN